MLTLLSNPVPRVERPAKRRVLSADVIDISDDEENDSAADGWPDSDDEDKSATSMCRHASLESEQRKRLDAIASEMQLDTSTNPRRSRRILPFVNSAPLFFEAHIRHRQRNKAYLDTMGVFTPAQVSGDIRFRTFRSHGDDIAKVMRLALESFNMTRTFLQISMHNMAMNVMASAIYENEWEEDRARILEANNWRDYPPIMAAICARRFGKTTGVSMLAASAMISIPECAVGCFAPTLRQATSIMQMCWSMLTRSSMFTQYTVVRTKQVEIVVKGPDGTERSLIAYPSTHKVSFGGR